MNMQAPTTTPLRKSVGSRLLGVLLTAAVVTTVMPVEAADAPAAIPDSPSPTASEKPTYYVIKRISIVSDSGIRSINVGTPVELVAKTKSACKIRLTDGTQLATTMDHLSFDANAAQRLADQERAAREATDTAIRQWAEADQARRSAQAEANEAAMREAQKKIPPTTSTASTDPAPQPSGLRGSALDAQPEVVAKVAHPKPKKK
jgi:hypothetical protein